MDPLGVAMKYHDYASMTKLLTELSQKYPHITNLTSIGESVHHKNLWLLKIGSHTHSQNAEIANMRLMAGINGNERATTEVLLQLIEYMLTHYGKDFFVTQIIDKGHLYFLPMINPDGSEIADIGQCNSSKGLTNANNVDLDESFYGKIKI